MMVADEVSRSVAAVVANELQLHARGIARHQIAAATRYAWRRASGIARRTRAAHAESVFIASLDEALDGAERWVAGNQRAARDGDMDRGVQLAVKDDRAERGYQRLGVDGGSAAKKWAAASDADTERYRSFWNERSIP